MLKNTTIKEVLEFFLHSTNKKESIAEAKGNGGQSIFICPELDLVVVLTAGNHNEVKYNGQPLQILKEYILPAIL